MAKDVTKREFWMRFLERPEVKGAMSQKIKYESYAEKARQAKEDKRIRKERRYEIMQALMECSTQVKHLVSPMFRYKVTQAFLWKVLAEAKREGMLFSDKCRTPQVYHRLMALKAEITAGPYGVSFQHADEEVEEDLMDKMVVEADCIPGGIDGEAPERRQILDKREITGVLEFGAQIKSEGNEAFSNENWEGALTRYCQGDEMLKNFRAEPHLEHENKELKTMHRACLNNKANVALKMDQWQNALRASEDALKIKMDDEKALFRKAMALEGLGRTEEALETLEEIQEIANDMDEEYKESILNDVQERREIIRDIDKRAAEDYRGMFKRMGDKKVFGEGRFLADGITPVPPALTAKQEQEQKKQKDRMEYLEAKAEHDRQQRFADGKPQLDFHDDDRNHELPSINRPPRSIMPRTMERTVTITMRQAEEIIEELHAAYSDAAFQKEVHDMAKAVMYEHTPFVKRLKKTAFRVQEPILSKWGFDPTEEGLHEMLLCLSDHTIKNAGLRKRGDECQKMLYGGENGMFGLEDP